MERMNKAMSKTILNVLTVLMFLLSITSFASIAAAQQDSSQNLNSYKTVLKKVRVGESVTLEGLKITVNSIIETPCSSAETSSTSSQNICGYAVDLTIQKNSESLTRLVSEHESVTAFEAVIAFNDYSKEENTALLSITYKPEQQAQAVQAETSNAYGSSAKQELYKPMPNYMPRPVSSIEKIAYGVKLIGRPVPRPDIWDLVTLGDYVYGVTSNSGGVINSHLFKINTKTDEIIDLGNLGWEGYSLTVGKDGRIYGGMYMHPSYNAHLFVYDPNIGWEPGVNPKDLGGVPVDDPKHAIVWTITTGSDGKIYAGIGYDVHLDSGKHAQFVVYDPETNTLKNIPLPEELRSEDSIFRLVAGKATDALTSKEKIYGITKPSLKLFSYDPKTGTFEVLADIDSWQVSGALTLQGNYLYIATGGALWRYDLVNKKLEKLGTFCHEVLWKAITTKNGLIHIAANNGHVYVYDPKQGFDSASNPRDLGLMVPGESRVRSLTEANNGFVYGGTAWHGMVFKYNAQTVTPVVEDKLIIKWFKPSKHVFKTGEPVTVLAAIAVPETYANELEGVLKLRRDIVYYITYSSSSSVGKPVKNSESAERAFYKEVPFKIRCGSTVDKDFKLDNHSESYVTCLATARVEDLPPGSYEAIAMFTAGDLRAKDLARFKVLKAQQEQSNIVFTKLVSNKKVFKPGEDILVYGRYYLKSNTDSKVTVELYDSKGNLIASRNPKPVCKAFIIAPLKREVVKPVPMPGGSGGDHRTVRTVDSEQAKQAAAITGEVVESQGVEKGVESTGEASQTESSGQGVEVTSIVEHLTSDEANQLVLEQADLTTETTGSETAAGAAGKTSGEPETGEVQYESGKEDVVETKPSTGTSSEPSAKSEKPVISKLISKVRVKQVKGPLTRCGFKTRFKAPRKPGIYKIVAWVSTPKSSSSKSLRVIVTTNIVVPGPEQGPVTGNESLTPPQQENPEIPSDEELPVSNCDNGCLFKDVCIPIGTRVKSDGKALYCDLNGQLSQQKPENSACDNNFECLSNSCLNGKCVNLEEKLRQQETLLKKILTFLKRLFGKKVV